MHARTIDYSPVRMRRARRATSLQPGSSLRPPRGYYRLLFAGTRIYLRSLRTTTRDTVDHTLDSPFVEQSPLVGD